MHIVWRKKEECPSNLICAPGIDINEDYIQIPEGKKSLIVKEKKEAWEKKK